MLKKRAPNLVSAADEATNVSMAHKEWMGPFSLMGLPFMGRYHRK